MSKVITLSRIFPAYHPKKGQPTYFVEKVWKSLQGLWHISPAHFFSDYQGLGDVISGEIYNTAQPKHHTIRAGKRWKTGDKASLRVWSGKPYNSPQIAIAPDVELVVKDIEINGAMIYIDGAFYCMNYGNEGYDALAGNDGLSQEDLQDWFPAVFSGQMLIWNNNNLPY